MFPHKGKVQIGETKVLGFLYILLVFGSVFIFLKTLTACFNWVFSLFKRGDKRSLNNPCRKMLFSACHSSNLNDSEQEETHHIHICEENIWMCSDYHVLIDTHSQDARLPEVENKEQLESIVPLSFRWIESCCCFVLPYSVLSCVFWFEKMTDRYFFFQIFW